MQNRNGILWLHAGIIVFLVILVSVTPAGANPENEYNILYLNSYHQGMKWGDAVTSGVISGIHEELGDNGRLYIEYLDTKRFVSQEHYDQLYHLIIEKYQDAPLDCIIVSDDYALSFIKEHYSSLFNGTPVVFCGINYFTSDLISFSPDVRACETIT